MTLQKFSDIGLSDGVAHFGEDCIVDIGGLVLFFLVLLSGLHEESRPVTALGHILIHVKRNFTCAGDATS